MTAEETRQPVLRPEGRQVGNCRLAAREVHGWSRHGTELGSREKDKSKPPFSSPRPGSLTPPLLSSSPTVTILRANPYPEVTDRICRLPLPTLFYRLEALHLGDLLRIWVRSGVVFLVALTRIFKVREEDWDTAVTAVLFAIQTLSPC